VLYLWKFYRANRPAPQVVERVNLRSWLAALDDFRNWLIETGEYASIAVDQRLNHPAMSHLPERTLSARQAPTAPLPQQTVRAG